MTSTTLDQLVAALTVDAEDDHEAEQSFAGRLRDLLDDAAEVLVMGRELRVERIEPTRERRRVRAVVTDGEKRWRVSIDALEFPVGSPLAMVICAYRRWLGDDVSFDESWSEAAGEAVAPSVLQDRVDEIEAEIDDALTVLEAINLEDIEEWLGADDPWGYNEKYWPKSVFRYQEQTERLGELAEDLEHLMDAGWHGEARRLLEIILIGLEGLVYDYFCPENASAAARAALPLWLRCLAHDEGSGFDADAAARRCARWIDYYQLYWRHQAILDVLPASMEAGLIRGLEQEISSVQQRPSVTRGLSEFLVELRIKRDELSPT